MDIIAKAYAALNDANTPESVKALIEQFLAFMGYDPSNPDSAPPPASGDFAPMAPGATGTLTRADVEAMMRQGGARSRARMPPAAPSNGRLDPRDTKAIGEAFVLSRLPAIMGANPAHVENVRARMAAGQPVGVLSPARLAEVRAFKARPAFAA